MAAVAIVGFGVLALPALAGAAGTGSISGTVVADGTSLPVAGYCVTADAGVVPTTTQTDANGDYTLSGLDDSPSYKVIFFRCSGSPNFASEWWNNKPTEASADPVAVSGGGATQNVDASLAVGGRITGKVTNALGEPVGACIQAEGLVTSLNATAETGPDGTYTLSGLPTDSYKLFILPCGPGSVGYAAEWYEDAADFASADPVSVTAGQVISGIDAVVGPAEPPPPPPDTTAPDVEITAGPSRKTKSTKPRFGFASSDPSARFECSVDGGAAVACSSPYRTRKLRRGKRHTFSVVAIDEAANRSAPAERKFKVKKKRR